MRFFCSLLIRAGPQPFYGRRYTFAVTKNRRSSHEHIGASFNYEGRSRRVDAPVHFQVAAGLDLINHLPHAPDLWQGRMDEMLVSEARIDRHDQHLIHVLQDFLQHLRGRCRIDHYAGALAQAFHALYGAMQIVVAFPVNEK